MTGYVNTLTHNSSVTLTVAGSGVTFKLASGMTYTRGAVSSALSFTGTSGTTLITTAGKTVGNVTFNGAGGTWQLQDNLTTASSATFTLQNGTLDTNSTNVSIGTFQSNSPSFTRVLTLGSSLITLNDSSVAIWNVGSGSFTVTANTATVTYNAVSFTDVGFVGGGFNYNGLSLVINGSNVSAVTNITGANTFGNLTRTGGSEKTSNLRLDASQTVTGTFTVNGNSSINRVLVYSDTFGTARTITAATVSVTNADFRDITGAGAGNWDISGATGGSGDAGGNSGITFTTGQTNYWIGGSGSWSTVSEWANTSGGSASSGRVPLPQDDARFDANSFSGASQTVTLDMPRAGKNINWTGVTNTPAWAKTLTSTMYGSMTLVSGMTNSGTTAISMQGRSAFTWTNAGQIFTNPLTVAMIGGTLTLQDAFSSSNSVTLSNGTLNANNFNVTASSISISGTGTRTLTMGSGIWTVSGTGTVWNAGTVTGLTFNKDTATTTVSNNTSTAKTFAGGGLTYYNASFSGDNITVTGSNTFNNFAIDNAGLLNGLKITSGTTQTINTLTSNGSVGNVTKLLSSTGASAATLSKSSGTVSVDYISIQDSTASGGATWNAGSHAINVSGNTGWNFAATLTTPVLTIQAASSIGATTTVLNGTLTDTGGENNTAHGFQYGTTTSYGMSTSTSGSYGTGAFSLTADNLLCNTLYHARAYSTNSLETGYSSDVTFTTGSCPTYFYASPTGSVLNNGSYQYPWTFKLITTGANGFIQPGDTIYLKGGTYTLATTSGIYNYPITMSGLVNSPIVIRSYPGEWAKIDGNLNGVATKNATLIDITGNYIWYRDFEITNSETATRKISDSDSNPTTRRANSIDDRGNGNKFINLVIHDTGQGIGAWGNGENGEYYGNIIYNNGWDAPDRGHGHNIYTQNDTGWKRFFNNIALNPFSLNIQMYGSSDSDLNNFTFEGNSWANSQELFGGNAPTIDLSINKNYFYKTDFTIGYGNSLSHTISITDNYIASSSFSMSLAKDVNVLRNTIIRPSTYTDNYFLASVTYNATSPALTDYFFDYNTYYKPNFSVGESFYSPSTAITGVSCNYFWFNTSSAGYGYCGSQPASWQDDLGYDLNGTYTAAAPTTDSIFYRKNKYDANRMNIIAYNWDGNTTVSVDPSLVLDSGDSYEIHNTQDYFDDVITGTYNGSPISISMSTGNRTLEKPVGYDEVVAGGGWYHDPLQTTTFPTFGAFVVVNTSGTTDVADPVISNVASTTDTTTATITWDTDEDSTTILDYGLTTSYGTSSTTDDGTIYGTFYTTTHEISLASLTPGTTYHYRLTDVDYAGNSTVSGDYTFTTDTVISTLTTSAASSLTTTSATLNGSISTSGGDATQHGFAYGTSATLSTVIATTTLGTKSGTGSFTSDISSLTCATTYYTRAYATNAGGTGYGSIVSFTTSACPSSSSSSGSSGSRRIQNIAVQPTPTTTPVITIPSTITYVTPNQPTQTPPTITPISKEVASSIKDLPEDILTLIDKFPELGRTIYNLISTTKGSIIEKLKKAKLTLPGLSMEVGSDIGIPVSSLTTTQKAVLPTEVVFAKSGDLIDYNVYLNIGDLGNTEQTIHAIAGKPIDLAIKIDKPVKEIKGYLTIKNIDRIQATRPLIAPSMLTASIGSFLSQSNTKIPETTLVINAFTYSDPDKDGIYTAHIDAPLIHGEYDIMTIMEYKDGKLGSKEFHLTAVIDPEGYIYVKNKAGEIRIKDAAVSILWKNPKTSTFELWPSAKYKQINPQKTDATGMYSFLVPEGIYKLTVTTPGYYDYAGQEFQVVQGTGIHENIELKAKGFWSGIWRWIKGLFS